jgi:hypothetical protein
LLLPALTLITLALHLRRLRLSLHVCSRATMPMYLAGVPTACFHCLPSLLCSLAIGIQCLSLASKMLLSDKSFALSL